MIEVEVLSAGAAATGLAEDDVRRLCELAAARLDVHSGHVAVTFVDAERMTQLNSEHRNIAAPTDVLSFPIDGRDELAEEATRELGDIVICPAHTADVPEAIVHGMLHLLGFDHESDDGEMLALQAELLA